MEKNKILYPLLLTALLCIAAACSKIDAYKEIAGDMEHSYPGKIENVVVFSGDERVVVTGNFISDPKVVKCRIYWDLKTQYVDVPVDMSGGPQSLNEEIPLTSEKSYNFDIYTYDAEENYSVPVNASGRVYGAKYKASITNRLIENAAMQGTDATIRWYYLDSSTGPLDTSVTYTNTANEAVTVTVAPTEQITTLVDYKRNTEISYFTRYKPGQNCIDTFSTATIRFAIN
jgi:hypothetical protein